MGHLNTMLAIGSGLVLLGVVASKLSTRLGVPALLLFLGLGMLAGSDGPGGIEFADFELAQGLGVVALAFILFSGGLETAWADVRPVAREGVALATVGVVVTAAISGTAASWAFDLPLTTGLLIGAIISSTDAAAVFSVLRSRSVSLRGQLRPLLELESGSNDPMAVFLTIGLLELVTEPDRSPVALIPMFLLQGVVGGAVGLAAGRAGVWVVNRMRLDYEGLYPVLTLAVVGVTYSVTSLAGGSGFLAVYLAGLHMGRCRFIHKASLVRFHSAVAWMAQIVMFVVLGLLVFPAQLPDVAGRGLVIAAILIFVARPVAVMLTLWPFRMPWRERTLVAWVGLRGAAPIILATFPLMEGAESANIIFDTVFFIVLTSVLIQGTTIPLLARRLGVSEAATERTPWPVEPGLGVAAGAALEEVTIPPDSPLAGRAVVDFGLPNQTIIVLVEQEGSFAVPTGATVLRGGDRMLVLGAPESIDTVRRLVDRHD